MIENEMYVLPIRNKFNMGKKRFVVLSVLFTILVLLAADLLIYIAFPGGIGCFPIIVVIPLIDIGAVIGCFRYIYKHNFAYGDVYEKYQIVNAMIYGIQNMLKILLVLLLINILVVPIYCLVAVLFVSYFLFRITRRF